MGDFVAAAQLKQTMSLFIKDDLVFVALTATFFSGVALNSDEIRTLFKALPIILLFVRVLLTARSVPHSRVVAAGLFFGCLGDALLELERRSWYRGPWFVLGLAAFLIGHALYIWAFLATERDLLRSGLSGMVRYFAAPWFVAVVVFALFLTFGRLESALVAPVFVYAMTIMTMLGVALVLKDQWVTFGALLFVCSDLLLAVDRFVVPVPQSTFLIMTTYYGAQFFIATSFA
jgi:alkenylglycerophosphocholine/alkenylglycerophosphoethanolamine hydrolase